MDLINEILKIIREESTSNLCGKCKHISQSKYCYPCSSCDGNNNYEPDTASQIELLKIVLIIESFYKE